MTKKELRKEAEEYFKNLDKCKTKEMMIDAYVTGAEPREKRIAELEAELKERHAEILEAFASASSGDDFEMAESAREIMEILNIPCYRHGKVVSKLTQAKELLKRLLEEERDNLFWEMNGADKSSYFQVVKQAEQFLKEVL